MGRTKHMGCFRGKRVGIRMKDGTVYEGRFYEQDDYSLFLDLPDGSRLRLRRSAIQHFAITGARAYGARP